MAHWEIEIKLSDFWRDDALTLEQKRDKAVERIKKSGWRDITPYPDYFDELVDEFAETLNSIEFDFAFGELSDQADADNVRIITF